MLVVGLAVAPMRDPRMVVPKVGIPPPRAAAHVLRGPAETARRILPGGRVVSEAEWEWVGTLGAVPRGPGMWSPLWCS